MLERLMALEGNSPDAASLGMRGSYPAPPGPDWGWRIAVTPDGNKLTVVMQQHLPERERGAGGRRPIRARGALTSRE